MQNVFRTPSPSWRLFAAVMLFYSIVFQLSAQNVSCSVANKVYVAPGQQGQARVLLNNWEKRREVKRVSYTLTIGGVTGEEHVFELEKPLTYNDAASLTVDVPPAARPGVDDFMVTIVRVDGEPNRNSFPMSSSKRYTLTRPVWRKAVVEDLTGMWCPNCPPGIASLEHLNRVAADRYIGLAAHDGDALGTGDYYEVFRLFPGRPKIVLNGSHNVSPYFGNSGTEEQPFGLLADVQKASGAQTTVQLKVQAAWSADRKSVDVRSATVYRCPVAKNKYRLAYVLTADSLKHPSFVQFNNAAGDSRWKNSVPEMQVFYTGGSDMRGLAYNDVVVSAAGVRYGIAGSLPEQMQLDTLYEHSHRFGNLGQTKPYRYVKQNRNLHVVALLIDPDTRNRQCRALRRGRATAAFRSGSRSRARCATNCGARFAETADRQCLHAASASTPPRGQEPFGVGSGRHECGEHGGRGAVPRPASGRDNHHGACRRCPRRSGALCGARARPHGHRAPEQGHERAPRRGFPRCRRRPCRTTCGGLRSLRSPQSHSPHAR